MSTKLAVTLLLLASETRGFAPVGRRGGGVDCQALSSFSQGNVARTQWVSRQPRVLLRANQSNHDVPTRERDSVQSRRKALATTALAATTVLSSILTTTTSPSAAQAYYEKNYPEELVSVDGALDGRMRKKEQVLAQEAERTAAVTLGPSYKPFSSLLWGAALWLLSGSRSNPVATPLANVLYDKKQEKWLKDRNDGLFADLPLPFLLILAVVFTAVGFGADTWIVALADGDRNISLQLAGVSLISGASLELGRIASGEKAPTRDEADRQGQLVDEFREFAQKRLVQGGNCHKTEVVRAFRRYFAKYRQADSEEYPLTDLEIERLIKRWTAGSPNVETTSSGFYYGLSVNKDADVFV